MVTSQFSAAGVELARSIQQMRKSAGLTQRQLAARLGREHNYVARIETLGRRVDVVELIQICLACEKEPAETIRELVTALAALMPPARRLGQRKGSRR